MKPDTVKLIVHNSSGSTTEIGSWRLPGELIDNFENQRDIGWHIFFSLVSGAKSVEVVVGEVTA